MIENYLPLNLISGSSFICPVCGNNLAGSGSAEICAHVLFIYDNENEELLYNSDPYAVYIQEDVDTEPMSGKEILENLIGELKGTTTIFFEITYPEPTKARLTVGIDLAG